jgi:heat shock protein HtpX
MASNRISFYDQISNNKWKSFMLLAIIFIVIIALGYIIGLIVDPSYFPIIMIFAIMISMVYTIGGYYGSDKLALASVSAQPASRQEYPMFHNVVEGLCLASGLPKPGLYIMKSNQINAFASGRDPNHAVICVTTGCLQKLDKQELEGVLGHELSHIANFDIRFMTIAAILVGMISIISQIFLRSLWLGGMGNRDDKDKGGAILIIIGIALAILAPIFASLVQLAISRKREYTADASAVQFIRSPTGLTRALKKIDGESASEEDHKKISKAIAPLFISDPLKERFQSLFSTHPPIKKRIELLERM